MPGDRSAAFNCSAQHVKKRALSLLVIGGEKCGEGIREVSLVLFFDGHDAAGKHLGLLLNDRLKQFEELGPGEGEPGLQDPDLLPVAGDMILKKVGESFGVDMLLADI
jgi:hypothetical protein